MGIAAKCPEALVCHIQCISCSSGPCPSCLSPDSDLSSSLICLQLISVRSHPHPLLCSEMHMRRRFRHGSAHASPARGEWLTVRALPAILSAIRWCLIVALSFCTSGSESKVILATVQQPKPSNTPQAACPLSSVALAWLQAALRHAGQQTRPCPIISFVPLKLAPSNLSPAKLPIPTHVLFDHGHPCVPSSLVSLLCQIAKVFHRIIKWFGLEGTIIAHLVPAPMSCLFLVWVFFFFCLLVLGVGDSRIWPWPTHHRSRCVLLVAADAGCQYGLGRKYCQAREKNWEGF